MSILKNYSLILLLIIVLASLLRLPALGQLPVGITIDEAGQGLSAYSILKTGKDEWGDFLPLNPRGFGDYKPPVFMYLLVPSIWIFGLTEFAVRFPSAIAGILTVGIIYLLISDLFKNRTLGLLSALLMAISPWHVYYSRLGWESNIGLMFFILGIWLFIKGVEKAKYLSFSVLSFGLAALSYHSFKLLVPLMVISLVIIFWNQIKTIKKQSFIPAFSIVLVLAIIVGYGFLFSGASRRAADQSILKEENLSGLRQNQVEDGLPTPLNKVLYNRYQFLVTKVTDNYLGYYSFSFLFGPHRSDGSILNFPSMGLLYIWQLPLLLLGIWYLIKNKSKASAVIFSWLLIAPIPAAITQDYMHAGRAQAILPAFTIISTVGLYYLSELIKSRNNKKILLVSATVIIGLSVLWRIDNYLFHTFNRQLGGLTQGHKEIVEYTKANYDKYDKIIFTKGQSEPHGFVGFYGGATPEEIQEASGAWKKFETDGLRFLDMTDYNLGKYEFKNVDYSRDRNEKNALIIAVPKEIPELVIPKFKINDISGKTVFVVIDTNEIPE